MFIIFNDDYDNLPLGPAAKEKDQHWSQLFGKLRANRLFLSVKQTLSMIISSCCV